MNEAAVTFISWNISDFLCERNLFPQSSFAKRIMTFRLVIIISTYTDAADWRAEFNQEEAHFSRLRGNWANWREEIGKQNFIVGELLNWK